MKTEALALCWTGHQTPKKTYAVAALYFNRCSIHQSSKKKKKKGYKIGIV